MCVMCVMAFGNRSVGLRVGRSVPLSPFSPAHTSFTRPLCLVTTATEEEEGAREMSRSGFQYQTMECGFEAGRQGCRRLVSSFFFFLTASHPHLSDTFFWCLCLRVLVSPGVMV